MFRRLLNWLQRKPSFVIISVGDNHYVRGPNFHGRPQLYDSDGKGWLSTDLHHQYCRLSLEEAEAVCERLNVLYG